MASHEEMDRPNTPKAVQISYTHQSNPLFNNPSHAPLHHHVLPADQLYFPQWVREFVASGRASHDFCVPIGHGNSIGLKESTRRWQIERLFLEGQADPEGLGPIRAHLLNQMLKGTHLAPLPPYGTLPYWQSKDAPVVSFDVVKAANIYSFSLGPRDSRATNRELHTPSSSKQRKVTDTKLPAVTTTNQGPSPDHKGKGKGKGKGQQNTTQAITKTPSHPENAVTEINPNDPWSRVTSSQTFDEIIKSAGKNNSSSNSFEAASPSNNRIARQRSSCRRLKRSRAQVQLASHSTDDYGDDKYWEAYLKDDGDTPARPPITGRVMELGDDDDE